MKFQSYLETNLAETCLTEFKWEKKYFHFVLQTLILVLLTNNQPFWRMDAYAKRYLIQMQVPNKETTSPGFQMIIQIFMVLKTNQ